MRRELPFAINAAPRPLIRYAWRGSSVAIFGNDGRIDGSDVQGLFFRLTRYLDRLAFTIEGTAPFLCSAAQVGPNLLEFTYSFPPTSQGAGGSGSGGGPTKYGIPSRTFDIVLHVRVLAGAWIASWRVTNRWLERAQIQLAWSFSADFAGIGEALAEERVQSAPVEQIDRDGEVVLRYAHDRLPLETRIVLPKPYVWRVQPGTIATTVEFERQQTASLDLEIVAHDAENPIDAAGRAAREERLAKWGDETARLHAPAESPLVSITNAAIGDLGSLALLEGPEEEWMYPGAGVPLYQNVWARDALTTGWEATALIGDAILRATITRLGREPATRYDPERDEQPGRILNREQLAPASRLGIDPFQRYYGDFASPFMFIIGLGQMIAWSGDTDFLRSQWETCRGVLDWARRDGDRDGDGYVEYLTESSAGPKHQGWKDSNNAVVDHEGRQVEPPIAVSEIQGYWFGALQFMTGFALLLGQRAEARAYWREAAELKKRFNRDFWLEDEGFVAFGLDAQKKPIRSIASNAGHCLASGIIDRDRMPRVVRRLFEPDMFSGWGIRTLSSRNPAYNPLSYHLGSVWTVENGTILFGLRRFGFDDRFEQLARALYDLALLWDGARIPECVGGYDRDELGHPGAYPRANSPQAWNQSLWPIMVQSIVGMWPIVPLHVLVVDPKLPWWLPDLTIRNIRVGEASVAIRFRRDESGHSDYEVLEKSGKIRVVRQPPVESVTASARDRLRAVLRAR